MAELLVRNLEPAIKERLKARAKRHGRSMAAEVREILRTAALEKSEEEVGLGTAVAERFKGIGIDLDPFIEELRKEPPNPATFDD